MKWREYSGDYKATITFVEVAQNKFYDSSKENSTPVVLHVTFNIEDRDTMETTEFQQMYINPLTGGKTLFQQLLDACGLLADLDEGEINEEALVDQKVMVTFGKREKNGKSFDTIIGINPLPQKGPVEKKKKAAKGAPVFPDDNDDLPFD
nr:MAG: protein of unknown function DUF669 [Podoviridae sp. ctka020]